jgi:aspartyl-tRNA(Asn)/glutamyl-tRNA(Gln) amidotransferase subunit B
MGDVLGELHSKGLELDEAKITPSTFVNMLKMIKGNEISGKIGKIILPELITSGKSALQIVDERGMRKVSDREVLGGIAEEVFSENAKAVGDAMRDDNAVHYLIGQLMKKTNGKGDPKIVNEVVWDRIRKLRGGTAG